MKNGNMSKAEINTLSKAFGILEAYKKYVEGESARCGFEPDTDYAYMCAVDAVAGLRRFIIDKEGEY